MRGRKVGSMATHPCGQRGQSAALFLPGQSGSSQRDLGRTRFPLTSARASTVITLTRGCGVAPSEAMLVHAFGSTGTAEDQVSWPGKANRLVATSAREGSDAREAVKDKVTQVQRCRVPGRGP